MSNGPGAERNSWKPHGGERGGVSTPPPNALFCTALRRPPGDVVQDLTEEALLKEVDLFDVALARLMAEEVVVVVSEDDRGRLLSVHHNLPQEPVDPR